MEARIVELLPRAAADALDASYNLPIALMFNLLHAAHSLGFGASWVTEWYAYNEAVRGAIGLGPSEKIAGFIYIGTAKSRPPERPRPDLNAVVQEWKP